MLLEERVALVTGASRGIGRATAKMFAKEGAQVAVNYLQNEEAAQAVVREIQEAGGTAMAVQADVTQNDHVHRMITQVQEKFGAIDTLVLNAGLSFPVVPFLDYTWKDFETKLSGELKAAFLCCQEVVPSMVSQKRGCIISISSTLSRFPSQGFCAHSSAKSALDAFIKSLALELGPHGIRVNSIAPGLTMTDATDFLPDEQKQMMAEMTPLRRNAQPEDIAGAILLLASNYADFITANYLPVCGGMLMV
ncbi:Glucose 1-dehydrogenase [Candidatus Electronema halotolerans]